MLGEFWHEASEHVVVEFFTLRPTFFFGTGVNTPELPLAHTELQQLVSSVVNGKVKLVEENAIRLSLFGRDKLGVTFAGERFAYFFDRPKKSHRLGRRFDRSAADFNCKRERGVILW